jgi:UMF1 family MFS transporter
MWGFAAGIGGFAIALLSPILGAISDATGPRKPWIFGFSALAALGVVALWFVTPGADSATIYFGLAAFVIALIGFEFAAVFNNAMMPGLVSPRKARQPVGQCLGARLCRRADLPDRHAGADGRRSRQRQDAVGLDADPRPRSVAREGDRASGPLTAIWYIVFIIPLFLFTPDTARRVRVSGAVAAALSELWQTIRNISKERSLFSFLLSSMFYRDALNGLYTFGGIYAVGVLGWTTIQLGVFGISGQRHRHSRQHPRRLGRQPDRNEERRHDFDPVSDRGQRADHIDQRYRRCCS